MRSADVTQSAIFSYRTLEQRIPQTHPLRKLREVVDGILGSMHAEFKALYSRSGRPSIAPERLLRASLINALRHPLGTTVGPALDSNLLHRWFVGFDMDDSVWDHSVFSKNRDRLVNEAVARSFFGRVLALGQWHGLVSSDHFRVDGTLIEAWASLKSFVPKDGSGTPPPEVGRSPTVDFKGERRSNDTHASSTDPEARLYKKAEGEKSRHA